jgi:triosephosphate isomerase
MRPFLVRREPLPRQHNSRFVYTGSVNAENAPSYAALPDVDGFVVGRAGLDAAQLLTIYEVLARAAAARAA